MTDEQKLDGLKRLGNIIKMDKEVNNGLLTDHMKQFSVGALYVIEECNESWCESCEVKKALGGLCSEVLDIV